MPTILIELPGGQGVLRGDDGEVVITEDVSNGRGRALRGRGHRPLKTWVDEERSLVGGLLPPRAVSAEVIDDRGMRIAAEVGRGAYAAIVEQPMDGHEPVVCCRDDAGAPVRWPLPADYPSVPVDDAEEPCPGCGAVDYDEHVPTESWRGGRPVPDGRTIPSPIVVCRVCGHEEPVSFFGVRESSEETEDEAGRGARIACARAHARTQRWYSDTMTLRAVTFPVYAAEGWPAMIGGSGSRGDRLTTSRSATTTRRAQTRPREVGPGSRSPPRPTTRIGMANSGRPSGSSMAGSKTMTPIRGGTTPPTPPTPCGSPRAIANFAARSSTPPAPNSSLRSTVRLNPSLR